MITAILESLSFGLLWDLLPLLGFGPVGIGVWLLKKYTQLPMKLLVWGGALLAVLLLFWAFDRQRDQINDLRAERERLIVAVKTQTLTIDYLEQEAIRWETALIAAEAVLREQELIAQRSGHEMENLNDALEKLNDVLEPEAAADRANVIFGDAARRLRCSAGAGGEDCPD